MRFHDLARLYTRRGFLGVAISATWALVTAARARSEFIRYDARARRVDLTVIAGFDKSNSGYNFNGGSHGGHRITVPTGWRMCLTFVNRDVIRHSVVVIHEQTPVPLRISRPSLSGAASRAFERGQLTGARQDDIVFAANRPGTYLIASGVPGDAALGTYLRLTVSSDATAPTYEVIAVSTTC